MPRSLQRLRIILFAGEVFPMKYLRQLAELLPQVELLQSLRSHRNQRLHLLQG